jgi:predicted transposase/invertase (TIGR01784 family)
MIEETDVDPFKVYKKKKDDKEPRRKNDILLKGAVEDFFPYVLRFFYNNADEIFDMNKGFEWKNTELHEIQPLLSQKGGSRAADLLVKVHLMNGSTELFLLHMEIQKVTNDDFSRRVFEYWYRLTDKHKTAVVSLAVFTGLKTQLQPDRYNFDLLGTELNFKYNTYQIFNHTEEELINMDNPFALVVIAAQQEAIYNKNEQDGLFNTRMKIVKALKASNKFNYKKIKEFLYFMDQLIPLTDKKLKTIFDKEITNLFGGKITMGIMEAVREQILDEGIEQGIGKGIAQIAIEMKKDLFPIEQISKLTKLSLEEIEALV